MVCVPRKTKLDQKGKDNLKAVATWYHERCLGDVDDMEAEKLLIEYAKSVQTQVTCNCCRDNYRPRTVCVCVRLFAVCLNRASSSSAYFPRNRGKNSGTTFTCLKE